MEHVATRFREVTEQIEKGLNEIPYDKLNLSEEVQEQIALVHAQFRRAKERMDSPANQLQSDLYSAQNEKFPDPSVLKRLSEKLQLRTAHDLKREWRVLHEMLRLWSSTEDPWDWYVPTSALLKKLQAYVLQTEPELVIPDDFLCSISYDWMRDPVIVSSGQTYERAFIQNWLNTGNRTCPNTRKPLSSTIFIPNHKLKSKIDQWCDNNGISELPKKLTKID